MQENAQPLLAMTSTHMSCFTVVQIAVQTVLDLSILSAGCDHHGKPLEAVVTRHMFSRLLLNQSILICIYHCYFHFMSCCIYLHMLCLVFRSVFQSHTAYISDFQRFALLLLNKRTQLIFIWSPELLTSAAQECEAEQECQVEQSKLACQAKQRM